MRERGIEWAAGLFEGEGWFTASTYAERPYCYARAALSMTDHEEVLEFVRIMGCGTVHPVKLREPHHQPQVYWLANKLEDVWHTALTLAPWLSQRRLVQAANVLAADTRRTACPQ